MAATAAVLPVQRLPLLACAPLPTLLELLPSAALTAALAFWLRRQGTMERWNSASSGWQRGHLVLTQAGWLHFFPPASLAAKAAAASGVGGGGSEGGGSGGGSSRVSSSGHLAAGSAAEWSAPLESLNLARCGFEEAGAPGAWRGRAGLCAALLDRRATAAACHLAPPGPLPAAQCSASWRAAPAG